MGQSVAGTSRRRNAGMCCCQTSPHLRFLTHYGEQQLRWIRPCRRPITQVYWVLLTGSATSFQGTSVCPFVGQIPCSFVAASESTKGKGTLGRRFLPVTGLHSPFFWTPCGPSGFGFTEQSSKGSSICPVGYSLPTTIRSIGALCAGALSDFTTVPTGKRGASLCFLTLSRGGSGENRTHGRLSTHGGFQDRCLKPLGHTSLFQRLRIGYLRERKNKSRLYRGSSRSSVGRIPFPWLLNLRLTLMPRPTREAA